MLHKLLIWIASIASILGLVLFLIEKSGKYENKFTSSYLTWGLIIGGILLGIFLALTDKGVTEDHGKERNVSLENISESSDIISIGSSEGGDITITKGDQSTSASKRYLDALKLIQKEALENFLSLTTLIEAFENHPPQPFWDKRRPNESETAFQDRAKSFHKGYKDEVAHIIQKFPISTEVYNSHQRELVHRPEIATKLKGTYSFQKQVPTSINEYIEHLMKNIKFNITDTELAIINSSVFNEKLISAKILLYRAAAQYILTTNNDSDIEHFKEFFDAPGFSIAQSGSKEIWQEINIITAKLYEDNSKIIANRLTTKKKSEQREIDRLIKDPYLLMLRKSTGMQSTLSEGEAWALKNKELNEKEDVPDKLLSLAAFSYLESDGRASKYYFQKALQNPNLSELQRQFISASLKRVQEPDIFEGSIGVMIFDVVEEGVADRAGLKQGDVIYKINGVLINEPLEISSIIGKTSKDDDTLFEVKRKNKTKRIAIKGGRSLNFKATQLIILNALQL
ncbi:MAG: PDZ domain-containing protein [Deltaproteobacteria bacterium]|nr:PDZ domain-containing protein [Deltaproteobacteria bacterium]